MILHLSTQQTGGAAIAALRIHQALCSSGVSSQFLTLQGPEDVDRGINVVPKIYERFWQRGLHKLDIPCTVARKWEKTRKREDIPDTVLSGIESEYHLSNHPLVKKASVIHLHWIPGMFDWVEFFSNLEKPVVWTLHDMNSFMGIFHYEGDLSRASQSARLFEKEIRNQKVKLLADRKNMVCVTPSSWLSEKANASDVLGNCEHQVVRYAIDTHTFRPYPRDFSRDVFDLPGEKKILLVIAERLDDYRKGMDLLLDSIEFDVLDIDWEIVSVGRGTLETSVRKVHQVGVINDARLLALLYSAADLFVIPSREDNFPNVILESLCCGTPVVGMPAGGVPEAIDTPRDGIIAREVSSDALAEALSMASENQFDRKSIREAAVARFDEKVIAGQYQNIYKKITSKADEL